MCGIAGIVGTGRDQEQKARVEAMVRRLSHRGPDGCGVDAFPDVVLGHTRLTIVDLASGSQPMRDASGKRSIVFNGEIYGYREVRSALDYPFRTTSDTEVILALYDAYGVDMMKHLPGMFAFALWDDERRILFAARDRFGEKPLYYAKAETGEFVFASEIKALLASGLVQPKLDRGSLSHLLNRLYVPVGKSIYKNVQQLRPGHALTVHDGAVEVWPYWQLPGPRDDIGLGEATEEFRRLFTQAVRRQLVADVEVGAFLSGGLDSSSVVAVASELAPGIRTFSFGFAEGPRETGFAQEVASRYRTQHVELSDSERNIPDVVAQMASVFDEPFADSSAVPTYMISRLAARHLKVVLTGDGGDELLGGYPWYRDVWSHALMESRPRWFNEGAYQLLRLSRRLLPDGHRRYGRRLEAFNRHRAGLAAATLHRRLRDFVAPDDLEAAGFELELAESQPGADSLDAAMRTDLVDYMAGDILVKTDRASMANGLELRAPFLDVDLASFCVTLPSRLKLGGNADKILLRSALSERWPPSVRSRGKQGFGAPVFSWLRRPEFKELKEAYLGGTARQALSELLGVRLVERTVAEDDDRTWALLIVSIWLAEHPLES
jgi:asparagine synthase (glutamine-hydrolysing)